MPPLGCQQIALLCAVSGSKGARLVILRWVKRLALEVGFWLGQRKVDAEFDSFVRAQMAIDEVLRLSESSDFPGDRAP